MKNDKNETAGCALILGLYLAAITAILAIANAIWSNEFTLFILLSMLVIDVLGTFMMGTLMKSED